ncbi:MULTISPECIES: hypothetical protein [unclassified Ruegeria]|uniref:hypothetical protein n=1 Tax=unclassified Ruegeria TaxID=2625375 RepID=UPI0014882AC0|nr:MULTISPECIES: hypothetical protein [unclassified Ruegeria]
MKILRDTPNQLILSNTPWLIGLMLIGFILAFLGAGIFMVSDGDKPVWFGILFAFFGGGMGAVIFCAMVRRVQVILDRPSKTILIRRQSVFGYETVEHALSDLSHAEVETSRTSRRGSSSKVHRPVLILDKGMSAGRHPIVETYYSGGGAQRLVDAVNSWLPARKVDTDGQSA